MLRAAKPTVVNNLRLPQKRIPEYPGASGKAVSCSPHETGACGTTQPIRGGQLLICTKGTYDGLLVRFFLGRWTWAEHSLPNLSHPGRVMGC